MSLDLSDVSVELLKNLGSVTYVKLLKRTVSYNPVEGTETVQETLLADLPAAVTSVPDNLVDGTRIKSTDRLVLLTPKVTPEMTDYLRIGGLDHTIVLISGVNHAGTQQLWKVFCRG